MEARPIAELREKFFKKLETDGPPDSTSGAFHPADIARIKNTDAWLKRFLEHHEYNIQDSLNMLWDSCTWRKKFGTNDITEDNVKRQYLEEGVVFPHGKDRDGKTLFVIKSKLHTKNSRDFAELQRCIVYWFERLEREGNGRAITLFFDMEDTGLSNLDMELTKYLIGLFKLYYPSFLNNIIIYEMPWVANAAFKIIKSWLPTKAIPKIKVVNKTTLKDFVSPSEALKCWGGTNEFVFKFTSEVRTTTPEINGKLENRKVHFAENSPTTDQSISAFGDSTNNEVMETMLAISSDIIVFKKEGVEVTGNIGLRNHTADKCLSYKIKTTSPEKFKVRPSTGLLQPGQQCNIAITLQPGFNLRGSVNSDRFLVMCIPAKDENLSTQDLVNLWKTVGKASEQHRLKCRDGTDETDDLQRYSSMSGGSSGESAVDTLLAKMSCMERCNSKLHREVTLMRHLLVVTMILTVLMATAIIYILKTDIRSEHCHEDHYSSRY